MKKLLFLIISLIISVAFIFGLFGCAAAPVEEEQAEGKAVTFMVYMVGSDLEAKGGAGTDDLEEMAESGVELENANVLVYAGGSKKWYNEALSESEGHTLLNLTDDGFEAVCTMPEASMGEPESLTGFLNYAYENYLANEFALVLWDHGDGPLIGYGKDMLYDNDSLTLAEMRTALEESPFSGENKLSFVGFDACLMSSAELAVVWADHADYLIASQEIEPAFGWNYDFLASLGETEGTEFMKSICEGYLDECEKYYERKGYDDRDTTLACMDLSAAKELEDAINALFGEASKEVEKNFNALSASRVSTRALGRASTGSEYDLIDLYDMASQMEELYPDEAKTLMKVVEGMIVANETNTEGCCGMSIYYPFYNKNYYEKTWGEVYSELGVFSEYADYLDGYTEIWLEDDLVENVASSEKPETGDTEGEYVLKLTDAQAEAYADASYYILMREGDELYTKIYSAQNVTKNDNTLTAHFDGQILYAKNGFDSYLIPVTTEHDTVGDLTRYSVYVNLTNESSLMFERPEGYEHKVQGHRFHLTANTETKEISTSALVPYDVSVDTDTLTGGKIEDADLSGWTTYYFLQERHRYLTRYENGAICPVSEWPASDYYSAYVSKIGDGLEFLFAPLTDGEYYLIFEIEDTQGNKYCSEMLPIQVSGELESDYYREPITVEWDEGESVKLLEEAGVTVSLTTVETYSGISYTLKVKNENDFAVAVKGTEVAYNDKVYCHDGYMGYFSVPAGETVTEKYGISFGDAQDFELMDDLSSIQFSLTVDTFTGEKTLIYNQWFNVLLSEETTVIPQSTFYTEDFGEFGIETRGFLAREQVVCRENGLTVTLVGFGGNGSENGDLVGLFQIENEGSEERVVAIEGAAFDGIYMSTDQGALTVPANSMLYTAVFFMEDDLDLYMISSVSELELQLKFMEYHTLEGGGGFSETKQYPVKLSKKGTGATFTEGSQVIYEKNGVRIALQKTVVPEGYYSTYYWHCTVVNESGEGINISAENFKVNGEAPDETILSGVFGRDGVCNDGEKTVFTVCCDESYGDELEISFDLIFYDFIAEKVLWKSERQITLTAEK